MQHGQLVHLQVEADAQLHAVIGDKLDGLVSKLLLATRVPFVDPLLLAIDPYFNPAKHKNESEIDIIVVSISDAEARLPA